ncbi:hypothetical protein RYX36_000411 [Vicia faba]
MMRYDDRDLEEVKAAIDWEKEETNEEEEDITVYLSDKKENTFNKKLAPLEKSLVTTLFDYRKWNRPLRYIKNDHFERVVRDENSQFFFQVCQSDGKKRISFTYPPHLSTFLKIMEKKMDLFRRDKTSYNDNELSNYWSSVNKEKGNKLINEFFQRAKMIDNKSIKFSPVDVFENRIRLSDDNRKTKYLTKIYDPFLNGRVRGEIQKGFSPFIPNETDTTNYILINKIHEHEQVKIYSEEKKTKRKLLLDAIRTDPTNNTIFNRKLCSEINEISKEVPRWSYDLVDELAVLMDASPKESQIRSPKADRIVLFNSKTDSNDNQNSAEPDRNTEFAVVHYSREPDYCRDLIRGSMRPQRRKTVTYKLFQGTAHSPLFLEIMGDYAFLFGDLVYDISQYLKEYFRKPVLKVFNERKKGSRIVLEEIENRFKKRDELSESKKNSTISKSNPMIEESPVLIQSMNWTNFTEKRIKDLNVKTKTILKQLEKMTEEKKEGVITLEINLNSTKTTYDAKRLELLKNSLKILKRRTVRLIHNKKSYIYGYKSPLQANKNQTVNYNIPKNKKELFDIMGDSFIQNYIAEDGIIDMDMETMEKNLNRKYLNWMGKRKKNSKTNQKLLTPRFGFFSKLSAYKKNPWILPMNFFFVQFYGNKNITDVAKLKLEKKEYGKQADLKSYLSNYYRDTRYSITRYRKDLNGEQNFLLDKYFGFYLHCKTPVQETLMDNINLYCLLVRLKNLKQFFIMSIKKADLDFEITARLQMKDTCYTECRDTEELRDNLMFFIEPIRISRKNYEQFFIYQTISISLRHKRKILKRNYDLLVPENLLSTRRRRELRILICLNPQNRNTVHRNTINDTEKKRNNSSEVLTQNEDIDSDTKKLMTLKFFLWPNYRFEDLACMNRYWFDTHNGSRFSILRIHMYPRLKI